MTVSELIAKLQEMPQDYIVAVMTEQLGFPNSIESDDRNKVIIIWGDYDEEYDE